MKKILITVGLSLDLVITKEVVEQISRLISVIAPLSEGKIIGVISTEHREARACSEIMRQILKAKDLYKDSRYKNEFAYQGDSADILKNKQKEFITREFQYYEVLVVVCRDNRKYFPNQIRAQKSSLQFGEAAESYPIFFN